MAIPVEILQVFDENDVDITDEIEKFEIVFEKGSLVYTRITTKDGTDNRYVGEMDKVRIKLNG